MSAPPPTPAQQEAYMTQLRQQVQTQMMQELMNKMTEKCFKVRKKFFALSFLFL
jgi:hypothetical protein